MKRMFSRYIFVAVVMILSAQYSSAEPIPTYYEELSKATYESIQAMVESNTGLPNDRFDASIFDIMPQFAIVRSIPYTNKSSGASLESTRCTADDCRYSGNYGLQFTYHMPAGQRGSYNVDSPGFDVSKATYLEAWVKGAQGGERFEFVFWSDCQGPFPGRPNSGLISVSQNWELRRIPLADFQSYANLSSLCRLSIGFNDAIHPGGTIYIDNITFADAKGNRIHVPFDEETSVTNIGLYIASELSAMDSGYKEYDDVLSGMNTTLMSIEALPKWHGFPQTHNHVVSLRPSTGDQCISTVDMGYFAAGLILLRQRMPELSSRVSTLLNALEWDWLYDASVGLPYGCRYPNSSTSTWHYDWLSADSRLAHFIGIGTEKIPPGSWINLNRTPEKPNCSGLLHFEPGWDGGGLFMAFLPAIFLDEKKNELGISAHNFVQDQICYAQQIGAPAWGWSATTMPPYGADYCGYGCMRDEILVPHASILAAEYIDPDELYENLLSLEASGARQPVTDGIQTTDFGFRASLNWRTHEVTTTYLVLDQSMAFLSLFNKIDKKNIRKLFCQDEITHQAIELIPDYSNSCTGGIRLSLKSGWNLISVPLNLTTWDIGNESEVGNPLNVTPPNCLSSIYRYNSTSGLFEKSDHFTDWGWYPATGSESFTKLEPGRGYWITAQQDCSLTFTGAAPSDLDIPLNTGWNLIGWYSMNEVPLGEESLVGNPMNVTPANSLTSIYRYNAASALFEKSDHFPDWGWWPATGSEGFTEMEPGRGYWVMAQNDAGWRHKVG